MHFHAIILILACLRTTTLASPQHIRDEPGPDPDAVTLSSATLTLDSKVQANRPSPGPPLPVSPSGKLEGLVSDASVLEPVDQSANLLLDPSHTDSSNSLVQHLPDNLSPSYQPSKDPPNILDSYTQSSVSPGHPVATIPGKAPDNGPDCKG